MKNKVAFEWLGNERRKYGGGEGGEKDCVCHTWLLYIRTIVVAMQGHST